MRKWDSLLETDKVIFGLIKVGGGTYELIKVGGTSCVVSSLMRVMPWTYDLRGGVTLVFEVYQQ